MSGRAARGRALRRTRITMCATNGARAASARWSAGRRSRIRRGCGCSTRPTTCRSTTSRWKTCGWDLMEKTDTGTHCPYKGDASYWSLTVGGRKVDDILWSYETPFDEVPDLAGIGAFYWGKVDNWYEEDEEIFVHARDPYKRVDAIPVHARGPRDPRRRGDRAHDAGAFPVRDEAARPLLHPEGRRADRPADPDRRRDPLPLQGRGHLLVGRNRRRDLRGHRLELPRPDRRMPEDPGPECASTTRTSTRSWSDGVEVEKPRTKWSK